MRIYQNYHRHSCYTNPRISDSVASNEDYAKRAVELGQSILSSCEHGWQGNYAECYELAKQYHLKLLFASEAYWVKDRTEKDNTNCHIFLAAKNERGRQALNDVLSEANSRPLRKELLPRSPILASVQLRRREPQSIRNCCRLVDDRRWSNVRVNRTVKNGQ